MRVLRSRIVLVAAALSVAAAGAWIAYFVQRDERAPRRMTAVAATMPAVVAAPRSDGKVTIAGSVREVEHAVGDVDIVFRGADGTHTTRAASDGTYRVALPPGTYRVFVRDDEVLTVGRGGRVRLPSPVDPRAVGAVDDAIAPLIDATQSASGVDLVVETSARITGYVTDAEGARIAGAIVHAIAATGRRPAHGGDVAKTDATGRYELQVPVGTYQLVATHEAYAGVLETGDATVRPSLSLDRTLILTPGCVITGRVVRQDGTPAGDGAIERQWGPTMDDSLPAGHITADGSFRWTTLEDATITLRAWPWRAPPSQIRQFPCRDGARFPNVVFEVPDAAPDISGVVVDRAGAPVPFVHVDVAPLDPTGMRQQERADGSGKFGVFAMPAGRYHITAYAPGRGVATQTVTSPQHDVSIALSGTGSIVGTSSKIGDGSFLFDIESCEDGTTLELPPDPWIVIVRGGRFRIDDLPACNLRIAMTWRGVTENATFAITAGGTTRMELPVGPRRTKTVRGVVRDARGNPVAGAVVRSGRGTTLRTATADASGSYELAVENASEIEASAELATGVAPIGTANVDEEIVDITVRR